MTSKIPSMPTVWRIQYTVVTCRMSLDVSRTRAACSQRTSKPTAAKNMNGERRACYKLGVKLRKGMHPVGGIPRLDVG